MDFKNSISKYTSMSVGITALSALLLAGCGGGGNGNNTQSTVRLAGVSAVGQPIDNGTVNIKCDGPGGIVSAMATTNNMGVWSVSLEVEKGAVCAVEITGGTINGIPNTSTYVSIAETNGDANVNVNITPFTEMLVSILIDSPNTTSWFANLTRRQLQSYTEAEIETALSTLEAELSALDNAGDPVATSFMPMAGNPMNDALDSLAGALNSTGTTLQQLLVALDTNDTTLLNTINLAIQTNCANTPSDCTNMMSGGTQPPTELMGTPSLPITTQFVDINVTLLAPLTTGAGLFHATIDDAGSASTTTNLSYGTNGTGPLLASIQPATTPSGQVTFGNGITGVELGVNALDAAEPAAAGICSDAQSGALTDVLITTAGTPVMMVPGVTTNTPMTNPAIVLTFNNVNVNCVAEVTAPVNFYQDGTATFSLPGFGTSNKITAANVNLALTGQTIFANFTVGSGSLPVPLNFYLYAYPTAAGTTALALVAGAGQVSGLTTSNLLAVWTE